MTLNPQANYPGFRNYVLKIHRDAVPQRGLIVGRLENMASGVSFEFHSGEQLIACLLRDDAARGSEPSNPAAVPDR